MTKRSKSHKNLKRQAGSLKVWQNEKNGLVHEVARVHNGRVTRRYVGPEAATYETAHELMRADLKRGV